MSLLDETPRRSTGRRPLRYQKVIDLVDEIIRAPGPAAGQPAAHAEGAGRAGRREPDHRASRARELSARAAWPGIQGVGTFVAQPRIVSEPARRGAARHACRPRRPRRRDDRSAQGARRRARRLCRSRTRARVRRARVGRLAPEAHRRPAHGARAGARAAGARARSGQPARRDRAVAVRPARAPVRARRRLRGAVSGGRRRRRHRAAPAGTGGARAHRTGCKA